MEQFAICRLREAPATLVVVLQSDLNENHGTLVAAPLIPSNVTKRVARLNPLIEHDGTAFLLITNKLGAVPVSALSKPIGSAFDARDAISNALDYLFKGF